MEFPYCSPNYHLYTVNNQASGSGQYRAASISPHPSVSQPVTIDLCASSGTSSSARQKDHESSTLPTLSVKVIHPNKKSDVKLFILRNIELQCFDQPEKVRKLLVNQLADKVSNKPNFDFGYFEGNKRVWVKGIEDLREIRQSLESREKSGVVLWCMGKAGSRCTKRPGSDCDSDSEDDAEIGKNYKAKKKKEAKRSRYDEKLERIDEMVDELKQKHSNTYNSIQYRVWAETIEAGRHDNLDCPPKGSFFKAQGRKNDTSSTSITPEKASSHTAEHLTLTPSKIANLRSTYIQQIKELHNLMEIGAIDNEHFIEQRDVLLKQMDKLNM